MKIKTNAEKVHSVLLLPDESEKQVGAFNAAGFSDTHARTGL